MVLGGLQDSFQQRHPQEHRFLSLPLRGQLFPYTPYPLPPFLISMFWRLRCVHLSPVSIQELETLPTGLTLGHPGPGGGQHSSTGQRTLGLLGCVVRGGWVAGAARPTGSCSSLTRKASAAGGAGRCCEYVGGAQSSIVAKESPEGGKGSPFPLWPGLSNEG